MISVDEWRMSTSSSDLVSQEVVAGRKRRVRDTALVIGIVAALLVLLSPLVALVERAASFGDGYSITHFTSLFSNDNDSYFYRSPITVVWNSIRFALASMFIAVATRAIGPCFISAAG